MSKWLAERILTRMVTSAAAAGSPTPFCIVRPAIVTPTLRDPYAGWMEGFGGSCALMLAYGSGRAKIVGFGQFDHYDWIPADYCVNVTLMAAAAIVQNWNPTAQPPAVSDMMSAAWKPKPPERKHALGESAVWLADIERAQIVPVTSKESNAVPIFHVTTAVSNPVSLKQATQLVMDYYKQNPVR